MRAFQPFDKNSSTLEEWVEKELNPYLTAHNQKMRRGLSFDDNMLSFEVEESIGAGSTVEIVNRLPVAPDAWITTDVNGAGGGPLERGATAWTNQLLYIKNTGAAATFKIRFFSSGRRG